MSSAETEVSGSEGGSITIDGPGGAAAGRGVARTGKENTTYNEGCIHGEQLPVSTGSDGGACLEN